MDEYIFDAACTVDSETDGLRILPHYDGLQFIAYGERDIVSAVLKRDDLERLHALVGRHLAQTKPAPVPAPGTSVNLVFTTNMAKCARCGADHPGLTFRAFYRPMNLGSTPLTHWAPCPTTGEPIAVAAVEKAAQLAN